MPKQSKTYASEGCLGLVLRRRCQKTGILVGVYHGLQSGIEADPEFPWVTLCEKHANLVSHSSLASAKAAIPHPDWCSNCSRLMEGEPEYTEDDPEPERYP